jgi:hypothetical protein
MPSWSNSPEPWFTNCTEQAIGQAAERAGALDERGAGKADAPVQEFCGFSDSSLSLSAIRLSSGSERAFIFRVALLRWTHMGVFGSSGQVHRHIKNSGGCFGIQGLSPIS